MKTIIKTTLLTAILTTAWGCSSDNTESIESNVIFNAADNPDWQLDLTGTDGRPGWMLPDPADYENDMFLLVRLQDELAASSSDDDCMAVLINGECRGMSQVRNTTDGKVYYFLLKVHGNNADLNASLTLSYYSTQLKQLFTLYGIDSFVPERTRGFDKDFVPPLLSGSSKYPVERQLTVTLRQPVPFNVTADDRVAVFVGDECRGVGQAGVPFTVFARDEAEPVQLRYYSADKGGIYSTRNNITFADKTFNYLLEI